MQFQNLNTVASSIYLDHCDDMDQYLETRYIVFPSIV